MPFDLESKLVVAVASSALFDLSESDAVYRSKSLDAYRLYQRANVEAARRTRAFAPACLSRPA